MEKHTSQSMFAYVRNRLRNADNSYICVYNIQPFLFKALKKLQKQYISDIHQAYGERQYLLFLRRTNNRPIAVIQSSSISATNVYIIISKPEKTKKKVTIINTLGSGRVLLGWLVDGM